MMSEKILVIEDSATFRALLMATLQRKGYKVIGADTGAAGIQAAKTKAPDIISLDLSLPDISGVEVLGSLKSDLLTRQIPVIICTASVDGGLREEVRRRGAAEILTKPLQSTDLFSALGRLLRKIGDKSNGDGKSDARQANQSQDIQVMMQGWLFNNR
jgi:CheY-like chemotaxis protein